MDALRQLLDVFLHVDQHLVRLVAAYGAWIYGILFVIVFCETGLVVTPFLPGDSLLFAAGALCATTATTVTAAATGAVAATAASVTAAAGSTPAGSMAAAATAAAATTPNLAPGGLSILVTIPLLIVAAVVGDAVNYHVGHWVGPGFLERKLGKDAKPTGLARFIRREHLEKTQRFYEKYGGKTIVLARFVPIIRTFAPFVAGIGRMSYRRFLLFNFTGAVSWVLICTLAGYFFGALPFVKKNFELVVLGIIFVSIIPILITVVRGFFESRKAGGGTGKLAA